MASHWLFKDLNNPRDGKKVLKMVLFGVAVLAGAWGVGETIKGNVMGAVVAYMVGDATHSLAAELR